MNNNLKKIFTVSQLNSIIKSILETNINEILIKGEINNLKYQSSGHVYFTLVDDKSQISCVIFKNYALSLDARPKNGDKIILKANISVYLPRGGYQLIVKKIKFQGQGDLLLKLHELKNKLKNKGWFDSENKKNIVKFPKRIGVVTSPTGAVIQDILNVINRRFFNMHIILNPVKVQGEGAREEIAKAIDDFNKYNLVDTIIVGRGGGSIEDLWAFNEEIVAKAIFESKIPIISAVGHETDITISDLVADVRAPTPSAAAEISVQDKKKLNITLNNLKIYLKKALYKDLENYKKQLRKYYNYPVFKHSYYLFSKEIQKLDDIKDRLNSVILHLLEKKKMQKDNFIKQLNNLNPIAIINHKKELKELYKKKLDSYIENQINLYKDKIIKIKNHLNGINHKNLLKKGYSISFYEKTNSIILSVDELKKDDKIITFVNDGKIKSKICDIIKNG